MWQAAYGTLSWAGFDKHAPSEKWSRMVAVALSMSEYDADSPNFPEIATGYRLAVDRKHR